MKSFLNVVLLISSLFFRMPINGQFNYQTANFNGFSSNFARFMFNLRAALVVYIRGEYLPIVFASVARMIILVKEGSRRGNCFG